MDREQIARAARGNEDAFNLLVENYKSYLMAVILPVIRDPDQAQDVLQEAFWQVYRSLPLYRGGNFKVWLGRIAAHKAIDWQRRKKRQQREFSVDSLENRTEITVRSAEEEYLSELLQNRIAVLFGNLPPPLRATMAGYLVEGKSYRQLADEFGVTMKTVESRLYRARQLLKEQLKEGL